MPQKKTYMATAAIAFSMIFDLVLISIKSALLWCGNRIVEFLSGHTRDFE